MNEYYLQYKKFKDGLTKIIINLNITNKRDYLNRLNEIDKRITPDMPNASYLEAVYDLSCIYEDILKYKKDYESESAYESHFVKIPIKKGLSQDDKFTLSIIKDDIKKIENKIAKTSNEIKKGYLKCIAYILTMSVLLSVPLTEIIKIKNQPRERLYKTNREIYSSLGPDIIIKSNDLLYLNVDNIPTFNTRYEPLIENGQGIEILEYTPWTIEDTEAMRTIRRFETSVDNPSYRIDESTAIALLDAYGIKTNEYRYINKVPYRERKYTEKIYEIIYKIQDINDYIELSRDINDYANLIIILLTELLLYLCMMEFNSGPFIENIISIILKMKKDKKLKEEYLNALDDLLTKYESINPKSTDIITKKRLKNNDF